MTLSHKRALLPFLTGNLLLGSGLFFHAFLYNFYLAALGLDEAVMGLAAASLTAGGLVALLPAGRLVDHLGVRTGLVGGAVSTGLGLGAGALAEAPAAIYGSAFIAGMGAVTWRVSMAPYIMAQTPAPLRSRVFSWNVALLVGSGAAWMISSGAIAGWLQAAGLADALHAHRWTLFAGAILSLLAVPLFAVAARREAPETPLPTRGPSAAGAGSNQRHVALGLSVAAVACWMIGPALITPFFNIYFSREYQLDVSLIGTIFGVAHLATALVMLGSGEAAGRAGPRPVLTGLMAMFPPVLLVLATTGSVGVAIGLYFLQGIVSPATNPLIDEILLERAPPARRGAVSSWRNAATEIAGIVGAGAGGLVLRRSSFSALFTLAGAVSVVFGLTLWAVLRRRGRE